MNILSTQYTLSTKSFEIYVAGCNGRPHCIGCHNPESWNYDNGEKLDENFKNKAKQKIKEFDNLIDNIMIFGGEPLDQDFKELKMLLIFLHTFNKNIWLFTRYKIEEVPNFIKQYCEYVKCGRYDETLKSDNNIQYGIKLATSNQKIYRKEIDY